MPVEMVRRKIQQSIYRTHKAQPLQLLTLTGLGCLEAAVLEALQDAAQVRSLDGGSFEAPSFGCVGFDLAHGEGRLGLDVCSQNATPNINRRKRPNAAHSKETGLGALSWSYMLLSTMRHEASSEKRPFIS